MESLILRSIAKSNFLVPEVFDIETKQAIFESGMITEFQQGDRHFWRPYLSYIVFSKKEGKSSAFLQVHRTAERLRHEIGISDEETAKAYVEALCNVTIENFQRKHIKLDNDSIYDRGTCQQHLLTAAAYTNCTSVVQDLLAKGIRPDWHEDYIPLFGSALFLAARQGHRTIVEMLLSSSILMYEPEEEYRSHARKKWAIRGAIAGCHIEILDLVLESRWSSSSSLIPPISRFFNELRMGLHSDSLALFLHVKSLLRAMRVTESQFGWTPDTYLQDLLLFSQEKGHLEIAHYLLDLGANVNGSLASYEQAGNPLRMATQGGQQELVKFLLETRC